METTSNIKTTYRFSLLEEDAGEAALTTIARGYLPDILPSGGFLPVIGVVMRDYIDGRER